MEIFWAVVLFLVGSVVVIKGADFFVDAATWTSDVTGISRAVIGATVVAMATSGPEIFVSLIASSKGYNDMAVGNVIGSLICNIGIGFSIIAISRPAKNEDKLFLTRGIIMLVSTAFLFLCCLTGAISILHGVVLMLIFAFFTYINIRYDKPAAEPVAERSAVTEVEETTENGETVKQEAAEKAEENAKAAELPKKPAKPKRKKKPTNRKEITINVIKFIVGGAGVILGSNLIVDNAKILALSLGMSEMFVGLTIVAIGTSLPEIVTSIAAIVKKENSLGVGNIVGSNVFDATFILAAAAFISGAPVEVSKTTTFIDIPVAIALMLIAVLPTAIGKKLYRWQGILIAVLYVGYIVYLGIGG